MVSTTSCNFDDIVPSEIDGKYTLLCGPAQRTGRSKLDPPLSPIEQGIDVNFQTVLVMICGYCAFGRDIAR